MDLRQQGIEEDNAAFRLEIHDQIARPFALLNFGDPDLAPWTDWVVEPQETFDQYVEGILFLPSTYKEPYPPA